jgi:hypothetical protein
MPPIRHTNRATLHNHVFQKKYNYKYAGKDLNFDPTGDKHDKIAQMVLTKASMAYQKMQQKHADWNQIDNVLRAYVAPEDVKQENEDGTFNKIIVPISRITLDTIITYMMAAFIRDPIHQYSGTGPEDILRAQFMTEIVNIHARWFDHTMPIYTAFRDMFAYGIGGSHMHWQVEKLRGVVLDDNGQRVPGPSEISREGNALMEIDPYRLILDPNVPAHKVQEGEILGWVTRTTYGKLRRLEVNNEGLFFNVQYLQEITGRSTAFDPNPDHLDDMGHWEGERPVDVLWFYMDLIPKDHELGKGTDPEKWMFALAGDNLLIAARPANLFHDRFPVAIGCPDTDGHTSWPDSRLGSIFDLQEHVNFLFSSHIANVKRSVNNELIYDPMMINEKDINDPKPGKRIRLRKPAWGRGGIDNYVTQLKVQDLTQQNMNDVAFLRQLSEDTSGSKVNRGQVNQGPRISSAQAQADRFNNLSRLEKDAILISSQYMRPMGRMFAAHTQQFMTQGVMLSTTGELQRVLKTVFPGREPVGQVEVDFEMLLGNQLDLLTADGTIPGREDPDSWITLLQVIGGFPQAIQAIDIPRMIMHIARQLGAKSVDQFINTEVQVQPDEQILRQVRAGNLVAPRNGQL